MSETAPDTTAAEAELAAAAALARRNLLWGFGLLGLFVALFGGTAVVALVYLWLS